MRRRPLLAILPVALMLAVVASGCGATPDTPAVASPPADATTSTTNPRGALAECLARQGVSLPAEAQGPPGSRPPGSFTPGSRPPGAGAGAGGGPFGSLPPGVSQPQFDAAIGACQSALPAPAQAGGAGAGAFGAYASCLRDHGFTLPAGGLAAANGDDPAFVEANKTCGVLAP